MKDKKTDQEIRDLVIARLSVMPNDKELMIGGNKKLNKTEMIESVKNDDEIGRQIIDMQMTFLRDVASGKLFDNISIV